MMLVDVFLLQSKRKEIVRVLPILLLLTFLFFFGCTSNGDVITIPFSESQFYARTTDLNYVLFVSGYYDGNCLVIDNNKISVVDCGSGGGGGSSSWSDLTDFPVGCSDGQAVRIIGATLTCVDLNGYALLDGSNQPFTGNLNLFKVSPEFRLTDSVSNEFTRIRKFENNEAKRTNKVLQPSGVVATGGDEVVEYTDEDGTWRAHIFTTVGTSELNVSQGGVIEYLVVGGGGGGGHSSSYGYGGGGGGAGGLLNGTINLNSNSNNVVIVGNSGAGGVSDKGNSGSNSSFNDLIAIGGGGGGKGSTNLDGSAISPLSGGSGGGGGAGRNNANVNGAAGTPGQGFAGGRGSNNGAWGGGGGGGGGAGSIGLNGGVGYQNAPESAVIGGAGGNGHEIWGETYAIGGAGGNSRSSMTNTNVGRNGYGDGGGGGRGQSNQNGRRGGSGIVVVRYLIQGLTEEATIWKSEDGFNPFEKGIQTYGDGEGRTVLDGRTLRFNIGGAEKAQLDASGNLRLNEKLFIDDIELSKGTYDINLQDGLVSYWKMDEISGTTMGDSVGTNTGTATNARMFTTQVAGKINTGLDFTGGDDRVDVSASLYDDLQDKSTISWSGWIYPISASSASAIQGIATSSNTNGFYLSIATDKIAFSCRSINTDSLTTISSDTITFNQWYHVTGVVNYQKKTLRLYLNGELVAENTNVNFQRNGLTLGSPVVSRIGMTPLIDSDRYFNGYMDEIGIWTKELSQSEIRLLFNSSNARAYEDFEVEVPVLKSDKSIESDGVMIANDFITKSKVADINEDSLSKLDNFEEWKKEDGSIDYEKHYAHVEFNKRVFSHYETGYEDGEVCEIELVEDEKEELREKEVCRIERIEIKEPVYEIIKQHGLSMETRVAEGEGMIFQLWNKIKEILDRLTGAETKITALESENALIKSELCKKDLSYAWCKLIK